MSDIFALGTDHTILGLDGNRAANGQVHFYDKATGEYAPVYGDAALRVALRQPVQADSSGVLPIIYLDDAIAYRAVIADRKNNPIRAIDDVRRHRPGIKVLDGVEALKRYCGHDPFVLVAGEGGCPVFYKRVSGCHLPEEQWPDVIHADCCPDCCTAWVLCRNEPDICAMETAELNCDHHVLVQECGREVHPDGSEGHGHGGGAVKKASIGALLSAGAKCLPRVCIPYDAPELALDSNGGMVAGDRVPPDILSSSSNGYFAGCLIIAVQAVANPVSRHLRLDDPALKDVKNQPLGAPEIRVENRGPCRRRYEIRALNRCSRAREWNPQNWLAQNFHEPPAVDANYQTRLGKKGNTLLDDVFGVGDFSNNLPWLTELSIADSTMGAFKSGHHGEDTSQIGRAGANAYTENDLIVTLNPGEAVIYTVKHHLYWDANATDTQLALAERIHIGTRIIARPVY
jgi:hypothetical protein